MAFISVGASPREADRRNSAALQHGLCHVREFAIDRKIMYIHYR
ncbi:hypothetical protein [Azospirillum palustre]